MIDNIFFLLGDGSCRAVPYPPLTALTLLQLILTKFTDKWLLPTQKKCYLMNLKDSIIFVYVSCR
jgi:hypothetical protein